MRKNILFYFTAFALLLLVFLFFKRTYQEMIRFTELTNSTSIVYNSFQALSGQIKNAAVLTPGMVKAGNSSKAGKIFFTDSQSVRQQIDLLNATVRDSVNVRIMKVLDMKMKQELSWILKSSVPDSIVQHKSPERIAAFVSIDSLVGQGIQRTVFLLGDHRNRLHKTIGTLKLWMILFIILSGILLIYTTTNLFRQKSKTKSKEREIADYKYALDESAIVAVTDQKGIIKYVNDNFCHISKYTAAELIGKDHSIINSGYHPKEFIRSCG